jgi:hypothetical protein
MPRHRVRTALFILALLTSAITALAAILPSGSEPAVSTMERYSPELRHINSVDEATVEIASSLAPNASEAAIADAIDNFLQKRFRHGYSHFPFSDNWVARTAAFFWDDLSSPVRADDILRYNTASCSQHTMVFQELLKRFGLNYARVTFWWPPHMATAAHVNGVWAFYDSDIEPRRTGTVPVKDILEGKHLRKIFAGKPGHRDFANAQDLGLQFEEAARRKKIIFEGINTYPAPEAAIFHRLTNFASWWGWLMLWALFFAAGLSSRPTRFNLQVKRLTSSLIAFGRSLA